MSDGFSHFTLEDLLALRDVANRDHPSLRWGQAICNRYKMTNPQLFYGDDKNTMEWIERASEDYQL